MPYFLRETPGLKRMTRLIPHRNSIGRHLTLEANKLAAELPET